MLLTYIINQRVLGFTKAIGLTQGLGLFDARISNIFNIFNSCLTRTENRELSAQYL